MKKLCPKLKPTLPSAKRNHAGKIVSAQSEIKKLLAKEYKNSKFPSTGKAHVRPRTPHQCKQDILTDILVIYIDSHTDILYYYTQLVLMNCTSVYTTHINGIHTHTHTHGHCTLYI